MAYVVYAVSHHNQPVQAKAEGESRPFIRVDVPVFQYVRMYKATWKQFNPAGVLADTASLSIADKAVNIQLETGFHEGEIAGTKANNHFFLEYLPQEDLHEIDEI